LAILRDRTFVAFCFASLFLAFVYMQAMSTFPLYLEQLGLGSKTYGRIIAVNGFMIVFLQMFVTSIITRFHRGAVVVVAAVLTGIGFGLKGLVDTALLFTLTVAIWTLGEIMLAPMMPSIVSDLAPVRLRARYMGVISMCHSGANTIGVPLGGLVLASVGAGWLWGGCFAIAMFAAMLYAGLAPRLAARPPEPAVNTATSPAPSLEA
jgi:MFS family permease